MTYGYKRYKQKQIYNNCRNKNIKRIGWYNDLHYLANYASDLKDTPIVKYSKTFEFENKNIGDWNGSDWQGFFQFLEKRIGLIDC